MCKHMYSLYKKPVNGFLVSQLASHKTFLFELLFYFWRIVFCYDTLITWARGLLASQSVTAYLTLLETSTWLKFCIAYCICRHLSYTVLELTMLIYLLLYCLRLAALEESSYAIYNHRAVWGLVFLAMFSSCPSGVVTPLEIVSGFQLCFLNFIFRNLVHCIQVFQFLYSCNYNFILIYTVTLNV